MADNGKASYYTKQGAENHDKIFGSRKFNGIDFTKIEDARSDEPLKILKDTSMYEGVSLTPSGLVKDNKHKGDM